MTDHPGILLKCVKCGGRYRGGTIDALLYRSCLCGGELRVPAGET